MITDLPEGTLFTYKDRGEWTYGQVVVSERATVYRGKVLCDAGVKLNRVIDPSDIPEGEAVHVCVWKGRGQNKRLESKRVISHKKPQQHRN